MSFLSIYSIVQLLISLLTCAVLCLKVTKSKAQAHNNAAHLFCSYEEGKFEYVMVTVTK